MDSFRDYFGLYEINERSETMETKQETLGRTGEAGGTGSVYNGNRQYKRREQNVKLLEQQWCSENRQYKQWELNEKLLEK